MAYRIVVIAPIFYRIYSFYFDILILVYETHGRRFYRFCFYDLLGKANILSRLNLL